MLKKIDSIENQRLLAMALATTEFSFEIEYLPGKRNVLADYGTRHIPDEDWPVIEEDPLELNSLFPFNNFTTVDFPVFEKRFYAQQDFEEFEKLSISTLERENHLATQIRGEERILVPLVLRRAVFWAAHFPDH